MSDVPEYITAVQPAPTSWWVISPATPVDGERRWHRQRVAAWGIQISDYVRPLVATTVPDGSEVGAPALRRSDSGYLVAAADLRPCSCEQPDVGSTVDPDWCTRCTGVVQR